MTRTRRQRPSRGRVSRDTVLFVVGLGGIVYQQYTGSVSIPLLVLYGVMLGLPGVQALMGLLPSPQAADPEQADTDTTGSPSRSPSRSSPRSSPQP